MTTKQDGKTMSVASALKQAGAKGDLLESDALSLEQASQKANLLVMQKKYYDAAKTYLLGIRTKSFVPTVLSNRAQASLNLQDYPSAFADAAASLTLRPRDEKTWRRYCKALKGMGGGFGPEVAEKALLDDLVWNHWDSAETARREAEENKEEEEEEEEPKSGADLKEEGNRLFKNDDFEGARKKYSEALFREGDAIRAASTKWSLCSLELGAFHDALAAASAALRINPSDNDDAVHRLAKSLILLGEPKLALSVIELRNLRTIGKPEPENLQKLRTVACPDFDFLLKQGGLNNSANLMKIDPPLMSDWVGPVETYDAGDKKGRGLRATQYIDEREIVLVQRPIVLVAAESTHRPMMNEITKRIEWDGLFAQIVECLNDGTGPCGGPLLPIEKFTVRLDSVPLLLPSRHEYLPVKDIPSLSPDRIEGIARVNSHGAKEEGEYNPRSKLKVPSSALYPAVQMMNHDKEPNCQLMNIDDEIVLVATTKPVQKGEELTYQYGDEEHVRRYHHI